MKGKVIFHFYFFRILEFLRTPRVRQYTKRIYSASLFFIFSTSIEILIWLQLDLIQVNYENSIFVCGTDFILILSTFINVLKLCCFEYTKRDDVMNKLNCIFYFSLFGFLLNLLETVYTLFGSFLNYFECKNFFNPLKRFSKRLCKINWNKFDFFVGFFDIYGNCDKYMSFYLYFFDVLKISFLR